MNLRTKFGSKYRVTLDESYKYETEEGKTKMEWWYHEIKGRHGCLYPYSDVQVAVCFNSNIVANRFNDRKWEIIQNGEEERTVLLPNEAIEEVLEAIQPKKVRHLNPEQKAKAVERLKKYAFKSNSNA